MKQKLTLAILAMMALGSRAELPAVNAEATISLVAETVSTAVVEEVTVVTDDVVTEVDVVVDQVVTGAMEAVNTVLPQAE